MAVVAIDDGGAGCLIGQQHVAELFRVERT
jgi:hypothetical protein